MAETLKSNFKVSNGTTEVKILDGAGSGIVYPILSIVICISTLSLRESRWEINKTVLK